jgi:hypothetical protein
MIGIVILVVVILALTLRNAAAKVEAVRVETYKEEHTLHKWSFHPETDKLTCTECGFVAGS